MPPKKIVHVVLFVLTIVNGLLYLGTVIDLLQPYAGELAYVLWIPVAPFISPAMLGLPWFNAWVNDTAVSSGILLMWILWIAALCATALYGGAAARIGKLRKPKA
jgi:hypothetical protein